MKTKLLMVWRVLKPELIKAGKSIYRAYDFVMTKLHFRVQYCSQCEKKIRHWVYHFHGLIYCQFCADIYFAELESGQGPTKNIESPF